MAPLPSPPALQEAVKASTAVWRADLHALFLNAKDRFPDVVWELASDGDEQQAEIWGHKAIVYARAPPVFQARYFAFRPAPTSSPLPYSSSPTDVLPGQSSLSLSFEMPALSRSPSPFRESSPTPSTTVGALLRIKSSINSVLFSNELEYLYTGNGLGEAFEFLFDTSGICEEGDVEESRVDKLRKDLVFMWRSRLYSDVRISLTGNFSSSNHEDSTAIFSSHRFILVSRSPYFLSELSLWNGPAKWNEPRTINLPSPPFTPASLHFTLGFIYTGTLIFSHRSYDLDTAFHIMRSASYLALDTLYNEIQARIVQEMMHGLFHTFLEFSEYERITAGRWATGGCRCRQCARRAPRVLEFACAEDVKNPHLERGARRALVGLFGEGWCTSEFAGLPQRTKDSILKGLAKRTTPMNIFPLLFTTQHALKKLVTVIDAWADVAREAILSGRKTIDEVLCSKAEECFEQREWLDILENDGVRFEDQDRVKEVMAAIKRGITDKNAPSVYQVLVSSILLRPHASDGAATLLSSTSHVRIQVEETRMELIRWMRKRWVTIRQECGFDNLDGWAIQEISHEIEVNVEDLFNPTSLSPSGGIRSKKPVKPLSGKVDNGRDTSSIHSFRASTINRGNTRRNISASLQDRTLSHSLRSKTPSTLSVVSSTNVTEPNTQIQVEGARSRAASSSDENPSPPLRTRSGEALGPTLADTASRTSDSGVTKLLISRPDSAKSSAIVTSSARSSVASFKTVDRPKSSASSFLSVRSQTSTLRNINSSSGLRRSPNALRPTSTSSTATDTSTFKTANSDVPPEPRSRRTSAASTISNVSVRSPTHATPRNSQASASSATFSKNKRPTVASNDTTKLSPANSRRTGSTTSNRTSVAASTDGSKSATIRKSLPPEKTFAKPKSDGALKRNGTPIVKDKTQGDPSKSKSTSGPGTINGALRRKDSSDTITTIINPDRHQAAEESSTPLRGATLEIGIPCIISLKRKRFMAFARYIGEVEGELGPWVGVEVPAGDNWGEEKLEEGRQWNDGTWGGVRYFVIGGFGSEWSYGDDRAVRRRRTDRSVGEGLKREGDLLSIERTKRMRSTSPAASDLSSSESRGLFVRPQQVLYVVDAVGSDL